MCGLRLVTNNEPKACWNSVLSCWLFVQAKKQFGWEPKVALKQGLALMIDDFSERLRVVKPQGEALKDNVLAKD